MDIQTITPVNFTCRATLRQLRPKLNIKNWFQKAPIESDSFVHTTFNPDKDLNKIKLGEKLNSGRSAVVYKTNFDGYVIRLLRGANFNQYLKKLKIVDDPNGLIIAADSYDIMQLMKYVKGEPLYGEGWGILGKVPLEQYREHFNRIQKLPDSTFAEYMREVVRIRKNGYDTDSINPNNFLLDGTHIGIVDLEKSSNIVPELNYNDLDPFVNTYHLRRLLRTMTKEERYQFSNKIRRFCDRMIKIAEKEGLSLEIPDYSNDGFLKESHLVCYLYHQDWDMIRNLTRVF